LLLNIALHGMEEAAGVRYLRCDPHGANVAAGAPVLVRFADDFVVLCHTRDQAEQAWHRLGQWLAPRGPGVQRGQDTHRPRGPGLRLLWVQRAPLPRQAAHQT